MNVRTQVIQVRLGPNVRTYMHRVETLWLKIFIEELLICAISCTYVHRYMYVTMYVLICHLKYVYIYIKINDTQQRI